jgi:long-subunit fatty acid transport protein
LATTVESKLPLIARAGGRWIWRDSSGRERTDLELDVTYETWSMLDAQTVHTEGILVSESRAAGENVPVPDIVQPLHLRDTLSLRLGGTHSLGRVGSGELSFSLGAYYDSAAAPPEWTRLSVDGLAKLGATGGVSYRTGSVELSLGSAYVQSLSRTVTDSRVKPVFAKDQNRETLPVVGNGTYGGNILIVSAGLSAAFGAR